MEREQVVNYLANLDWNELANIEYEVHELMRQKDKKRREKNKRDYEQERKRKEERGERFKEIVKPGMFVKCEGTRDGMGVREVLEVGKHRITARKITRVWRPFNGKNKYEWIRDDYITTHEWKKIVKILDKNDIKL